MDSDRIFDMLSQKDPKKKNAENYWQGSFKDYIEILLERPEAASSAFKRLYDMVASHGHDTYIDNKKKITRWHFFTDPFDDGKDAVFGLDISLMKLVNVLKAAAYRYGPEKRLILLHGPVGSSKSTIARLLKKGLEHYSHTNAGALYSYSWTNVGTILSMEDSMDCPIKEDPLHLISSDKRKMFLEDFNKDLPQEKQIFIEGELCPACRFMYKNLMEHYKGDWEKIISEHVKIKRIFISEKDRSGIGTFQPKDEKNQDSTELTGDINYRKIAQYGSDSDPRAFNFDGEFHVANRGIIEFVEVLKLDVAFLYDLLTASQEHKIKPKKYAQSDIDMVILGHTNEPEYRKLQSNEYMEALRDRTVKIDVPYITKLKDEVRIYEKDYNSKTINNVHIAPHTLEMVSMWSILTRLEEPKKANLSILQKLKLYNGKTNQNYTEDSVKELRKEAIREGLHGISPRYVQDKISQALIVNKGEGCLNAFILLNELESGLKHHSLISDAETKKKYIELISVVKKEYEDIVKYDVQQAISADEGAVEKICSNYIDNVKAFVQKDKITNNYTGASEEPDERLMRSIEEKIDISENRKEDFRREIMNYIGALALEGKNFDYKANERLHTALELKLFEDQKDSIKLTTLVSKVVDRNTQEKIDVVKNRLIKNHSYCEICAGDVLRFVASIFARGDSLQNSDTKL